MSTTRDTAPSGGAPKFGPRHHKRLKWGQVEDQGQVEATRQKWILSGEERRMANWQ